MGFLKKIGKGIGKIVGGVARAADPTGLIGSGIDLITGSGGGQQQVPGLPPQFRITSTEPQPPMRQVNLNGGNMSNGNGFQSSIGQLLGGDRIVMEPQQKVINTAPPGWVVVDMPDGSGKKAVRKEIARCLGLWKSRSKPPISASDWKKLKTANRVKKKAKKIAQTADFKCVKK